MKICLLLKKQPLRHMNHNNAHKLKTLNKQTRLVKVNQYQLLFINILTNQVTPRMIM